MKTKIISSVSVGILFLTLSSCVVEKETMNEVIDRVLSTSTRHALALAHKVEPMQGKLPQTFEGDTLRTNSYRAWISGFFPGVLWYLYENDVKNEELKQYAVLYTERVAPADTMTSTHDLGFMLNCSAGNGYRITGEQRYRDIITRGAHSLATRFSPGTGVIKSWKSNAKWQYPVIIDNMMNLEMLADVAGLDGDTTLLDIANTHAHTTMLNHFRPDYTCFHVVSYDSITGKPHFRGTHQGYADSSAWARGQGWALYGYTMMYRETGLTEYLEHARKVADMIVNHPNMPEDKVPYWDFNAPDIPNALRDASSAAIMASGFVELSQLDKSRDSGRWLRFAEEQIRSLASPEYLAAPGTNGDFILKHSVGNLNKNSEVDVPLTYADYYFVEALMRLKKLYHEN